MSEYILDSGHRWMHTCDDCGGAFPCRAPERAADPAPDWVCETCAQKNATIKALADALDGTAWRKRRGVGPCWCPDEVHEHIPENEAEHVQPCAERRAALRLAGGL